MKDGILYPQLVDNIIRQTRGCTKRHPAFDIPIPDFILFNWTAVNTASLSFVINQPVGEGVYISWGGGGKTYYPGTGIDETITNANVQAGWVITFAFTDVTTVATFKTFATPLTGELFPIELFTGAISLQLSCVNNQASIGPIPDLSGSASLVSLRILDHSGLSGYTQASFLSANITEVVITGCALTSANVDQILIDLMNAGVGTGGTCNLSGQTPPAPRTVASDAAYTYLFTTQSWTVTLDV